MASLYQRYTSMGENARIIFNNTASAFIIKGFALAIAFFSTPAFVSYFNDNRVLGLWYTLLSILQWCFTFDLGISNGMRNHLTQALTKKDMFRAKEVISSGIFSISIVTIILFAIGYTLLYCADLNKLLNISIYLISEKVLFKCTVVIFSAILLRFLLTTISIVFYSLQKSAINDFLALVVSVFQLLYVLTFHFNNGEQALIAVSWAYLIIANLPIIVAGGIIFSKYLRKCLPCISAISRVTTSQILSIGSVFFICQILYLILAYTNEFLISYFYGTPDTATYTFYYKITFLVAIGISLAMAPIWSIVTKAAAEHNFTWLNKLYSKVKLIGWCAVACQFLLVPLYQIIMNLWLGKGIVQVEYHIAIAFACFGSVFIYSSILSTIVCGLARMRLQMICYFLGDIAKIVLIIWLSRYIETWSMVVWISTLVLLPYCILQQMELNRFFNENTTN